MDFSLLLDYLTQMDREATLLFNFDGGPVMDAVCYGFSSRLAYVPLGVAFLWALIRQTRDWRICVMVVLGIALTVALCDQISASVIKPLTMRLRPSHNPEINGLLHYVYDYHGGRYGFVSSHASNSFGVLAFVSLLVKRRWVFMGLLAFTLCVCYSRVYMGVHYVGDIVCGSFLGLTLGTLVYLGGMKLWRMTPIVNKL